MPAGSQWVVRFTTPCDPPSTARHVWKWTGSALSEGNAANAARLSLYQSTPLFRRDHLQSSLLDVREIIATEIEPSNAPEAWRCAHCGFRGFWRGGAHCA